LYLLTYLLTAGIASLAKRVYYVVLLHGADIDFMINCPLLFSCRFYPRNPSRPIKPPSRVVRKQRRRPGDTMQRRHLIIGVDLS